MSLTFVRKRRAIRAMRSCEALNIFVIEPLANALAHRVRTTLDARRRRR